MFAVSGSGFHVQGSRFSGILGVLRSGGWRSGFSGFRVRDLGVIRVSHSVFEVFSSGFSWFHDQG